MTQEKNYLNCCQQNNWCWCWKWCPQPPEPPVNNCVPTANLLDNGDFEDEATNAWTFDNADIISPPNNPDKFSGDNIASLGLVNNDNASISQTVDIPEGCPLQLSFAAQRPQADQLTTTVRIEFNDSASTVFEKTFIASANSYVTFLYAIDTPKSATEATVSFLKEGNGELQIDLVVLKI